MIEHPALLVIWGTMVGVDLASVAQTMITRPLVAGTVAGAILGDVAAGATVGAVLELFALEVLPIGASRYPDYGLGAVAAAVTVAGAPIPLGLGPAIGVGLGVAWLGGAATHLVRLRNGADISRHVTEVNNGNARTILLIQWRCLGRDLVRAALITVLSMAIAAGVQRWLPITVRGALFVAAVGVGAGMAATLSSALRLGGRQSASWLAAGLIGGMAALLL